MQSVPDGSRTELCGYHFTVPSPVNPPYPLRRAPHTLMTVSLATVSRQILPISLLPSNLSTSGQPHLPACPQDINRTQRLVSVYIRARARTYASSRTRHVADATRTDMDRPVDRSTGRDGPRFRSAWRNATPENVKREKFEAAGR